jgi:predicted O-methyltransferase YrrM
MEHHSTFIARLAATFKPRVYVELGLSDGETFAKVRPYAQMLYGVDIKPNHQLEQLKQYNNVSINYCTTDDFFNSFDGGIDMAFIDANHCIDSVRTDFQNVLKRLNPGGVILLHDTDPDSNELFVSTRCGDAYKIVSELEDNLDLNIMTIPIMEAGLSVVTKKRSTRTHLRN